MSLLEDVCNASNLATIAEICEALDVSVVIEDGKITEVMCNED